MGSGTSTLTTLVDTTHTHVSYTYQVSLCLYIHSHTPYQHVNRREEKEGSEVGRARGRARGQARDTHTTLATHIHMGRGHEGGFLSRVEEELTSQRG
jgi:hypothetical protein